MIVLNILGYFGRNKQNSFAALISFYILVYMYAYLQVACVIHAVFVDGENNVLLLSVDTKETSVKRDQLKSSFILAENFIDLMFNFSSRFNSFNLTETEIALFGSLMLITPGMI